MKAQQSETEYRFPAEAFAELKERNARAMERKAELGRSFDEARDRIRKATRPEERRYWLKELTRIAIAQNCLMAEAQEIQAGLLDIAEGMAGGE